MVLCEIFWGFVLWAFQASNLEYCRGVVERAGRSSMAAESMFRGYVAGVAATAFIAGALVTFLLMGGFLLINLGMISKREKDHLGGRTPSDVRVLKGTAWPEIHDRAVLPAEEVESEEKEGEAA